LHGPFRGLADSVPPSAAAVPRADRALATFGGESAAGPREGGDRVRRLSSLLVAVLASALAACGQTTTCSNVAGTWGITGGCGADVCRISQTGCGTTFDCDGARGTSGSVSGSDVTWSGTTAGGVPGTCRGTVGGSTITGTCDVSGATCDFVAMRLSGDPVDSGPPPPPEDAGPPPPVDAGPDPGDAYVEPPDGFVPPVDSGAGVCSSFAGEWGVSGTCGADLCTITQTGCAAMFSCGGGVRSFSGTVSGDSATWRDARAGGITGTCTATLGGGGSTFAGSCTLDVGGTCTVTGMRL
jgi:hypothetical protein